jgi:hypothetical protein
MTCPLRLLVLWPLAVAPACSGGNVASDGPLSGGSTAELISPDGGTVTTPDGVTITVPAGALPAGKFLTVLPARDTPPSPLILVGQSVFVATLVGPAFDLGPTGTIFNVPVGVTLPFDRSKLPANASMADVTILTSEHFLVGDPSDGVPLTTALVDAGHVSAQTPHFSTFVPAILSPYVTPCAHDFDCASGQTCVDGGCAGG